MNDITQYEQITYGVRDRIATVTLNRPERRNAFTMTMVRELLDVCDRIDADDTVRVVVFTGAGASFCAGADLDEGFIGSATDLTREQTDHLARIGTVAGVPRDSGGVAALRIAGLTKPTLAAINGAAVGIGITMTLPMDMRIVAENARIGFVFARRGLVPEAASSWFLPRLVGVSKALEWVTTGRMFDAAEALAGGLAAYVVPDALATAGEIATEIAENTSPIAVSVARRMMWSMLGADDPWAAHALDSQAIYDLAGRPDVAEGIASFREKRPPRFSLGVRDSWPDYVPPWPYRPAD